MCRAIISLLQGNLQGYIDYNFMAIPVLLAFILELFNSYLPKSQKIIHCYTIITLSTNMVYYLVRLHFLL